MHFLPSHVSQARILIYSLHKKGGRLKEKELEQSILEPPVFSSICICKMLQCMRESRKLWFDVVKTDSTFTQILNQTVHLASPTLSLRPFQQNQSLRKLLESLEWGINFKTQ
ncbi:uncharacterized protein LOC110750429 isoform X1 [Prunus avium]|nr:uncharacterized protein LOC110750429 isoform X1 [Prunus avium]